MSIIEYGSLQIKLDDDGYLENFEDWNEKTACGIADQEGVEELSRERMEIIRFMRDYYKQFKSFPVLGSVCKNVHQPKDCVNEDFVDPLKAWKIAGLPKPSEEVISYLKR
jgi:tRNA 2-thiouridine synthesizing protein E